MEKTANGTFVFEKDTKRTHRFVVTNDEGEPVTISGNLYLPKETP